MNKEIDLRGLTCPEPVLKTKALLDDKTVLRVDALVDGQVNVNNLSRLARSLKLKMHSAESGGHFKVTIERPDADNAIAGANVKSSEAGEGDLPEAISASSEQRKEEVGTVIFLSKDKFGDGDPEFSNTLVSLFLQTTLASGHKPRAILLANSGVRLMDKKSSSFKALNDFKDAGVEVLACGLCVEYYKLKDQIPGEQITNMFAICEYMFAADKVISP